MSERRSSRTPSVVGMAMLVMLIVAAAVAIFASTGQTSAAAAAQVQPMELQGRWQGMRLTSTGSPSGQQLGLPAELKGVAIVEFSPTVGSRALQAGLLLGDVVVSVNGSPVATLEELFKISMKLDVAQPLQLGLLRRGQPITITLPGSQPMAAAMTVPMVQGGGLGAPMQAVAGTNPMGAGVQAMPPAPGVDWTMQGAPAAGAPVQGAPTGVTW